MLYARLRHEASNVFSFNGADTFVAPTSGRALYILSDAPSRARELLWWQPTIPLEEGLKKTIPWFQERLAAGNDKG